MIAVKLVFKHALNREENANHLEAPPPPPPPLTSWSGAKQVKLGTIVILLIKRQRGDSAKIDPLSRNGLYRVSQEEQPMWTTFCRIY